MADNIYRLSPGLLLAIPRGHGTNPASPPILLFAVDAYGWKPARPIWQQNGNRTGNVSPMPLQCTCVKAAS